MNNRHRSEGKILGTTSLPLLKQHLFMKTLYDSLVVAPMYLYITVYIIYLYIPTDPVTLYPLTLYPLYVSLYPYQPSHLLPYPTRVLPSTLLLPLPSTLLLPYYPATPPRSYTLQK
jgi:hypothetical protein